MKKKPNKPESKAFWLIWSAQGTGFSRNYAWYNFFMSRHRSFSAGFTLIEIIVTISIVAILAGAISINAIESSKRSRDTKRQADLRALQTAVELYKQKNGRYPAGCNSVGSWSGQADGMYACTNGTTQYIVGLIPEYIPTLPTDIRMAGGNFGYVYRTNANGTVYKIAILNTVESEVVTYAHEFSSCDIDPVNNATADIRIGGWCIGTVFSGYNTPTQCQSGNSVFQKSYAAWGGIAPLRTPPADTSLADPLSGPGMTDTRRMQAVQDTTDIICR